MKLTRKQFLKALGIGGLAAAAGTYGGLKLHKYIVEHPKMKKLDTKVILLGFDGMDFVLTSKWMKMGLLPNLQKLADRGSFSPLMPTNPSESPVSWAAYVTGCNPGITGIYDFLNRDLPGYSPKLVGVDRIPGRFLFEAIPIKKPKLINTRGGKALWNYTSENRIKAKYLRAPGAFPPDDVPGNKLLAGFGTPDIRGTAGTYSYYVDDLDYAWAKSGMTHRGKDTEFGGKVVEVDKNRDGSIDTYITGPANILTEDKFDEVNINNVHIDVDKPNRRITMHIQGKPITLEVGKWSDWIEVVFEFNFLIKSRGIFRAFLIGVEPHFELYFTPIDFHPLTPIVPLSYPDHFSEDLGEEYGFWKTQGWGYETWGMNEEILTEEQFWEDVNFVMDWESKVTYGEIAKDDWNLFCFIFQNTDRVQHMGWHLLEGEEHHPAHRPELVEKWRDMILRSYQQCDKIVGEVMKMISDDTILIVNSDHGFHAFRRAVNVNTWLVNNGYMKLIGQQEDRNLDDLFNQGEFWQNVDWSKTRAYALGLGQVYVNLDGREEQGIVADGTERSKLKAALQEGLLALRDPEFSGPDTKVILGCYDGDIIYHGPRETMALAPDLVIGFNDGYRTSWQTALGGIPEKVFEDNDKKWSGDHCSLDPHITKGIVVSSLKSKKDLIAVYDIVPTALSLLGIEPDPDIDGESFL